MLHQVQDLRLSLKDEIQFTLPDRQLQRLAGVMSAASTGDGAVSVQADAAAPGGNRRRWLILAVIATAQLMVVLDGTVVNIALPTAQRALGFTNADRRGIITGYALAFGSLLLLGGKLADLIGRKQTFIAGLIGFAAASAVGGASTSFGMLVTARAGQGAFGALLAPAGLSLLTTTFPGKKERGTAFGVYGAIVGSGAAVGMLLGGVLTEYLSWRWCLYINLFFAAAGVTGGALLLDGRRSGRRRPRLDLPGTGGGVRRAVLRRVRLLQRHHPLLAYPVPLGIPRRRGRAARRVHRTAGPRGQPAAAAADRGRPQPRRLLPGGVPPHDGRVRGVLVPHLLSAGHPRLLTGRRQIGRAHV